MDHHTRPTDVGPNRTGIAAAPARSRATEEGAVAERPALAGQDALGAVRAALSEEAPPVGTVPVPTTLKGMAKSALQALKGDKASVFVDKLGERLAFERTGVRLYEAVLAKVPAAHAREGTLTADELRRVRDDEHRHLLLVREAIESLGADPTAVTPCADVAGVQAMGLVQVVTDPRVTLTQALAAILTAELADNDGWKLLIAMAEALGQDELARRFADALAEEDRHLQLVRRWLAERVELQLGAKLPALEFGEPAQPA
jgi:rubrerythrin